MIINRFCRAMDSKDTLNKEFSAQYFTEGQPYEEMLGRYYVLTQVTDKGFYASSK